MSELRPIAAVPDPGYPEWEFREPPETRVGRRAVATATVTLALCFGGCGSSGDDEATDSDRVQEVVTVESGPADAAKVAPEPRMAGRPVDVGRTMDGSTLGLPLALGLSAEERAPLAPRAGSPATPPVSTPSQPVLLAMADKPKDDEHIQDNDVIRPKKMRPRKVRMSGCSRMSSLRRR